MICQICGIEAPTKHVEFHQNIGALVVRFSKSVNGNLCKSCIHKNFWGMTGTTLALGWWGTISLIVTPIFVLNNLGRYLFCLGMPPVPPGATTPLLTDEVVDQISPYFPEICERLNRGEELVEVATSIARLCNVTPGQIVVFVHAVAQSQGQGQ